MSDIKLAYGDSAALTITLANLAESAARLTGRASTAIDNTSTKYLDYILSGKITTGTSPTAGEIIEVWVWGQLEDTPVYSCGVTGTDAALTVDSANVLASGMISAYRITVDVTNDRTYWLKSRSIAAMFGGVLPKRFGVFVAQSTDANLKNAAGDQAVWVTPVYQTVA